MSLADYDRSWISGQLERVETSLLTALEHTPALRAIDEEPEDVKSGYLTAAFHLTGFAPILITSTLPTFTRRNTLWAGGCAASVKLCPIGKR
jgi:hypothetical protein